MGNKRISEFGIWQELRVIRTKDGQSLAELSRTSGVSLGYLSDLEGGHRWPMSSVKSWPNSRCRELPGVRSGAASNHRQRRQLYRRE